MNTNMTGSCGTLKAAIVPTDETGEAEECPDELIPDEPTDLLGKAIDINIIIDKAEGLPENLCKDTYVKFAWYLSNDEYQTDVIEGVGKDVTYGFKHHLKIDCVTEDMLKYFDKDALCLRVYGNPTSAKFKKMLTQKEKENKKAPKKAAREETKEEAKTNSGPKSNSKSVTKTEKKKKTEVVKMTTPDGKVVEVVKEKQGCCTIF